MQAYVCKIVLLSLVYYGYNDFERGRMDDRITFILILKLPFYNFHKPFNKDWGPL